MKRLTRQFTSKLNSKAHTDVEDQSPGRMKLARVDTKKALRDKARVKDQLTGMSKGQFHTAITNDTMFQIAQADISKALKQAGYTVTGFMPNLVNAAVDAAWGQVGKVSSGCEGVKAELEAVKARDVEMKLAHLREISMLRDQIRLVDTGSLKAIQGMSEKVQLYDPLNYLDDDLKTLVMEIVEEKLKELLTQDPDATVVDGKEFNHFAFNAFFRGQSEKAMEKYKEDNMKLREEVTALENDLSNQKATSSSVLATLQEESLATQESLENKIAQLKQELKSERSRAEGLVQELEKVKQQHQEALVRQNHYVAACQASFSQEQMATFQMKTSHDELKTKLNKLFSDHVDLKYELQESKKSEEEKLGLMTQMKQLERQAEKEAARVTYLKDLFQMVISEKTQGSSSTDQFQDLVEGAVAQVDQDSNPVMLQANVDALRNALQLAESRSRQVGQDKRQLEAELRDEKMSLLLTRAVNESLRPAGLGLPQNGSDDGDMILKSVDASQHHHEADDDGSAQIPETQSASTVNADVEAAHHSDATLNSTENPDEAPEHHSTATLNSTIATLETDFGLAAEEDIIKMDSKVRIPPLQMMALFETTHDDLMHICTELDGSDKRTNELEAAVADAMAIIRQYQSREMQIEAASEEEQVKMAQDLSEEEQAKMAQEQMEQLQKALMHEVSHRRSLQEQYQVQEEKLTKLLQQAPTESRAQSPSPSRSSDSPKPPPSEPSMTSLPSSLKEARSVQALNEKLQRKDDMIKMKQTQIKMLLAENERLRGGSSRKQTEIARLRAKLRMCVGQHPSAAAMAMQLADSDEASDSSEKYQVQDAVYELSGHEELNTGYQGIRPVKSDRRVGVVYDQTEDREEHAAMLIATRPHSNAASRRKPPMSPSPVGKPNTEEFNAGIVGMKVSKPRTASVVRRQSTEAMSEKNLLPEIKPTMFNESMNSRRRPLSRLSPPPAPTVRRNSAPEPAVSLSVLPVSLSDTPGMIDLGKSRPASSLAMRKR